ncbi:MAG: hypothetical protein N2652_02835 [Kiritimatiellae bacterium]|nr:hypothetical protein [Kiritimatiellia bacterium]
MSARRDLLAIATVMLLGLAFTVGTYHILSWQATAGDDFPPYSTLRSDPLGLRALYETIALLPGMTAVRWYEPLADRFPEGPGTLVAAGLTPAALRLMPSPERFAAFARAGGVFVGAFSADAVVPTAATTRRPAGEATPELLHAWGVELYRAGASGNTARQASDGWPWLSPLYFVCTSPAWEVWLHCEGRPVLISRRWQGGRLILASDSYLLSNEGLFRHRRTERLCAMFIGPNVWFAEAHLGVRRTPGWGEYVQRLRLHPTLMVLLTLGLLGLWRTLVPLLPPRPAASPLALEDRTDLRDGFLDLLRRHVPPSHLAETYLREWRRFCAPSQPAAAARLAAVGPPPSDRPPLEVIRDLHARIHQKE